jgi:positive regulator of sigma E activity
MAEQIGVILGNDTNGMTRVLTSRLKAHGGCHPGLECDQLESRVVNPINAGVGDVVKISLPQKGLFKGAAILYLLPIAALISGVLGGLWLGAGAGWGDAGSVLGGLGGLALGFYAVRRLGGGGGLKRQLTPVITEIIRPSGDPPKPPQASCCG